MSPSNWSLSPGLPELVGALACHEASLRPCGHAHGPAHHHSRDDASQPSCSMDDDRSSIDDGGDHPSGCYSAASFGDDYDYEQELDRWLEADPLSTFPDFRCCPSPAAALSQHSADARLISEALLDSDPCELSALSLLPPPATPNSDVDEHDPSDPPSRPPCSLTPSASSPPDTATPEDIARLLLAAAAEAPPTAPLVTLPHVPPVAVAGGGAAGDSSSGRGGSTCESASNSPRCGHHTATSHHAASSRLVPQPARPAAAAAAAAAVVFSHKSGGPCDHCGATESPQWRRGPPAKPMLCNACGTRYRRTHQLGSYPGRGGKGGSLPGRKRRANARAECRLHKHAKASSLLVCAA